MKDVISIYLDNIAKHADVLQNIPSSEAYISHIQSVVSIALLDVKRCLDEINKKIDR